MLVQKLKRTYHVTKLWRNAHLQHPLARDDPIQFGWKLQDGNYKILWFEGDQMPRDIALNITELPTNMNEDVIVEESDDDSEYDPDMYKFK